MVDYLETAAGRRIAYEHSSGKGPGIVFLGGFKSDMQGTKAVHLQSFAREMGRAFLRFDYSGHGQSSGAFEEGCIGEWAEDAMAAIEALTEGPQVLVGSSMGGWIALLVARSMPDRVAGLVGIAAAPDFTEDSMWVGFSDDQRAALVRDGRVELPSEYDDGPYVVTRKLIEDGRLNLVLRASLELRGPVRLLQGTADADVDMSVALRLLDHLQSPDARLLLVKGADHRFSTPECLAMIETAVADIT
ncbi:alpha/beta fold hydrolase [Oceaniovalibus sp. ACAM 378]|uniref:alpha/beta fold hydrolase n=1 Tax=Oceaniovalibus sp. ACAM 378 TaxID=2599923 RepID=UPI0011DAB6BF|nr:alpha/beta hydrolase [Oceaniovalibus sp. ACAM 378]TYB91045.1 alpha/beta hydrolase [Oceaniovalibus sp. ACAM 378]